jgi:PHD/YefM family antitoxin component YafN of YafNO toxin-antitoxin module
MQSESRPLEDLRTDFTQIAGHVLQSKVPLVLTSEGQPSLVLMSAAAYDEQLQALAMARLIAEGELDAANGRVRPARDFFDELRQRNDVRG